MNTDDAVLAAINGEDAAVYAYGIIGAHLSGTAQGKARRALDSHRLLRQTWQNLLDRPIAAPAAFDLPSAVTDASSASALAIGIENALVPIYADLASATSGEPRSQAVTAAMECATRAVTWGGTPQPFPGS